MSAVVPAATSSTPTIYALLITGFRGIAALNWRPARGVNVILGGGHVGKTKRCSMRSRYSSARSIRRTSPIPITMTGTSMLDSRLRQYCRCLSAQS